MNELMRSYLIDFDIIDTIQTPETIKWRKLRRQLPEELSDLLRLPIVKDADGNCLLGTDEHIWLVKQGRKIGDYSYWANQAGYEMDSNKFKLWDYTPKSDMKRYKRNHVAWGEEWLRNGVYFGLLLSRKLAKFSPDTYRVFVSFSFHRYVDCTIQFYTRAHDRAYLEGFEKKPSSFSFLVID